MVQELSIIFLLFITYSFIGWAWESILYTVKEKHFVNRGFLNGPYCPIYGCGALLVIALFQNDTGNVLILFLSSGLVTCVLEYFTSWAMEKLFHARWWDYSKRKFNLNGRCCLLGFVVFGLMACIILLWAQPELYVLYHKFNPTTMLVLSIILFILFTSDVIVTVTHTLKFKTRMESLEKEVKEKYDSTTTAFKAAVKEHLENSEATKAIQEFKKEASLWQSKRLIKAFPNMKSVDHQEVFDELVTRIKAFKKSK